ncbi:hypothetical protein D9619_005991 [Psilocybe cf. subviscida]|uniref:Uncharacterized protein n=1 Tax=Psilocybe cf. subviscida TaxID=2480587 RepID=A0A8H5BYZ5_9AGAR|nr:hypothetical protein D9619_005991 [Psilocybe cf. subviscida]
MALVVCFLWHISEVALDYIRIILALVFLPRVPLRDLPFREKKISPRSAVENTSKRKSSWNNRDIPGEERIGVATLKSVATGPQPRNLTLLIKNTPHARQASKRLLVPEYPSSNVDFSIYADASSPNLNKANLLAPMAPELLSSATDDLGVLRAASDRVSEILRESRRRLDAGEDSSTIRREARRKRAEELLFSRNQGANLLN